MCRLFFENLKRMESLKNLKFRISYVECDPGGRVYCVVPDIGLHIKTGIPIVGTSIFYSRDRQSAELFVNALNILRFAIKAIEYIDQVDSCCCEIRSDSDAFKNLRTAINEISSKL